MKWIKRLALLLLTLYGLACGVLFFQQEQMIFQATKLPSDFSFWTGEEIFIPLADEVRLHALWLRQDKPRGVILYWHGNRGSNRRCLRQAEKLYGLGYDVFMPDYRGYGKSGGNISSQKQLFADAQTTYDWLLQHYSEDRLVLLGYSLGSGIATQLAKENQPQQLFLVAPYRSMIAMKNLILPVAPSFLMKYPLRNDKNLPKINCPITLFHGTNDELIPFAHSQYLHTLQPQLSELVPLNGIGHRGAIFSQQVRRVLTQKLK